MATVAVALPRVLSKASRTHGGSGYGISDAGEARENPRRVRAFLPTRCDLQWVRVLHPMGLVSLFVS